ncbi:cupin domain-containing protein [Desertimonas flava]|uniref:cupin domain-containing protein n=1 Tax=Desertimonas flava TaxID=2064846 RepID=UPI0013C47A7F|nr:cupin domain-containing protein [Desertimonas flava]
MDEPTTTSDAVTIRRMDDDSFDAKGRRTFFRYRDLGLNEGSRGTLNGSQYKAVGIMETTGFHYHECEYQFGFVLRGWVEIAFADGRVERLEQGTSITIPGGTIHNEVAMSSDFELLEITFPAAMGTVAVDVDLATGHLQQP